MLSWVLSDTPSTSTWLSVVIWVVGHVVKNNGLVYYEHGWSKFTKSIIKASTKEKYTSCNKYVKTTIKLEKVYRESHWALW